jgi:hypothetical protein
LKVLELRYNKYDIYYNQSASTPSIELDNNNVLRLKPNTIECDADIYNYDNKIYINTIDLGGISNYYGDIYDSGVPVLTFHAYKTGTNTYPYSIKIYVDNTGIHYKRSDTATHINDFGDVVT